MYDKQVCILTDCMDTLAASDLMIAKAEQSELLQSIVDTLGSYPKPRVKGEAKEENPAELGAYLFASTARNVAKLGLLQIVGYAEAVGTILQCFENALGLIVE